MEQRMRDLISPLRHPLIVLCALGTIWIPAVAWAGDPVPATGGHGVDPPLPQGTLTRGPLTPPHDAGRPWHAIAARLPVGADAVESQGPDLNAIERLRGVNLTASSLRLASDYTIDRGLLLRGGITNSGTVDLTDVRGRFWLGHPDSGGIALGTVSIASLPAGMTAYGSISWAGLTGPAQLYFQVDPDGTILEEDEGDNLDDLAVVLRDDVPWIWQEVDGYCNYAGLTMLYNFCGADHSLYETVELAGCAHSAVSIDNRFYLNGGVFVCQAPEDYAFGGTLRNLDTDLDVRPTWTSFLLDLRLRLDAGFPVLTSVDPYYLPQPDWDPLRTYGIHSGHAVVVTGTTDSSVVVNDPGVGLPILDQPAIPHPERRGADVVVDLPTFRLAVESTLGTPYILINYRTVGPMPSSGAMLSGALLQSMDRLAGEGQSYGGVWHNWPPGWEPFFGIPAFATTQADMNLVTFSAWFYELFAATGGNLDLTVDTLANYFLNGAWACQLSWQAAQLYYQTMPSPLAADLAALASELALAGGRIFTLYLEMLIAIYESGGNVDLAAPYLTQLAAEFEQVVAWELDVQELLCALQVAAIDESAYPAADGGLRALRCSPNPFAATTTIRWHAGVAAGGALAVHDIAGRLIRTLPATDGQVLWNGTDRRGRQVDEGIYFIRDGHGRAVRLVKLR